MKLIEKTKFQWQIPFRKELAAIILFIVLFLIFPYLIRGLDPSAASIDPGILSAILLAVASILVFQFCTWWILKAIWPVLSDYSEKHFERHFNAMLSGQKVLIYLGFYMLLLYAFILVLIALI